MPKVITLEPPKYFPIREKTVVAPKINPEPVSLAGVLYYEVLNGADKKIKYILASKYDNLFGKPKKRKINKRKRKDTILQNWKK